MTDRSPASGGGFSAYRITLTAMLAGLALIFSYIEAILPFQPGIPGVKLGLANLVVLVALYRLGPRYPLPGYFCIFRSSSSPAWPPALWSGSARIS